MAVLPRHDSSATPTELSTRVVTSIEGAKQAGRDVSSLGATVGGIAETWQSAINHTQKVTKKNDIDIGVMDIQTRATEDSDISNVDAYYSELDELRATSLDGFSDATVKAEFAPVVERDIAMARAKVDSIYRNKLLDHYDAQRILASDINREKYFETGNGEYQKVQLSRIKDDFARGFIDEKTKVKEEAKVNKWQRERISFESVRDKLVKKQLKENQVSNELELLNRFRSSGINDLRVDDIVTMAGDDDIRPKFGEALVQYMNDPDMYNDAKYNNEAFNSYIDAVLNSKNKETINNVLEDALNKKNVAKDELSILIGLSMEKSGTLASVDEDSGDKPQSKSGLFEAVRGWFDWSKDKKEERSQGIKEIVADVEGGKDPNEALTGAMNKAALKAYPQIKNFPKEGKLVPDKFGNVRRWFPDGSYKDE